jgi:hypothetical protein
MHRRRRQSAGAATSRIDHGTHEVLGSCLRLRPDLAVPLPAGTAGDFSHGPLINSHRTKLPSCANFLRRCAPTAREESDPAKRFVYYDRWMGGQGEQAFRCHFVRRQRTQIRQMSGVVRRCGTGRNSRSMNTTGNDKRDVVGPSESEPIRFALI